MTRAPGAGSFGLGGIGAGIAFALMYLPLLAVTAFSFNAARHGLGWKGFTTDWYVRLAVDERVREAAINTAITATVSTAIAPVLGSLLALGLERTPWSRRGRSALEAVTILPVVAPDIILAACLVVAFAGFQWLAGRIGWESAPFQRGFMMMIVGHVAFQVSFVALVVRARIAVIGAHLEEAAHDLYATSWYFHRRVLLPLLAPGIVAGAILAFTLSLDDFVVTFFASSPTSTTLPLVIYASLRRGLSPEMHALSTVVFAASVVLTLALAMLSRPRSAA
ncbi:MAG: ABC transporter permease [Planctomycetes bacterium]|nr:ABC transporter permease [Planctomycetota bacterium]